MGKSYHNLMRKLTPAIALLALAGALSAQQTRREKLNPSANPADDAKPNSDKVPDVYAVTGHATGSTNELLVSFTLTVVDGKIVGMK